MFILYLEILISYFKKKLKTIKFVLINKPLFVINKIAFITFNQKR